MYFGSAFTGTTGKHLTITLNLLREEFGFSEYSKDTSNYLSKFYKNAENKCLNFFVLVPDSFSLAFITPPGTSGILTV